MQGDEAMLSYFLCIIRYCYGDGAVRSLPRAPSFVLYHAHRRDYTAVPITDEDIALARRGSPPRYSKGRVVTVIDAWSQISQDLDYLGLHRDEDDYVNMITMTSSSAKTRLKSGHAVDSRRVISRRTERSHKYSVDVATSPDNLPKRSIIDVNIEKKTNASGALSSKMASQTLTDNKLSPRKSVRISKKSVVISSGPGKERSRSPGKERSRSPGPSPVRPARSPSVSRSPRPTSPKSRSAPNDDVNFSSVSNRSRVSIAHEYDEPFSLRGLLKRRDVHPLTDIQIMLVKWLLRRNLMSLPDDTKHIWSSMLNATEGRLAWIDDICPELKSGVVFVELAAMAMNSASIRPLHVTPSTKAAYV